MAAAGRLKRREEERVQLEIRLQRLRAQRERVRVAVSQDVLADAIERLKGELQEGSIVARRRALKSFVHKVEVGKEKGTLYYTFPLQVLALNELVYLGSTPGGVFATNTLELDLGRPLGLPPRFPRSADRFEAYRQLSRATAQGRLVHDRIGKGSRPGPL